MIPNMTTLNIQSSNTRENLHQTATKSWLPNDVIMNTELGVTLLPGQFKDDQSHIACTLLLLSVQEICGIHFFAQTLFEI